MRRWIKWYGIDWINSTARDELTPAERSTFLDFVCLASYPGSPPGTFKVASWEALARKLNTPLEVILQTRDKCLSTRISVASTPESLLVSISNWEKYQAPLKPDNIFAPQAPKSDNKTVPQRREEKRREEKREIRPEKKVLPPTPHTPRQASKRGTPLRVKDLQGDTQFVVSLKVKFPDQDIDLALVACDDYWGDRVKAPKKALINWLQQAQRFQAAKRRPSSYEADAETTQAWRDPLLLGDRERGGHA